MSELGGAWSILRASVKSIAVLTIALFGFAFIAAIVEVISDTGDTTAINHRSNTTASVSSSTQPESGPSSSEEPNRSSGDHSQTTKRAVWNEQSKDAVRSHLKDGRSAKFRNVRFSDISGTPVTCGEVNAKNSFGGYIGFQGFIAGGSNRSLVFLEEQVSGFAVAKRKLCDG